MISLKKLAQLTPNDIIKNSFSVNTHTNKVVLDIDEYGAHYKFFMKAWDNRTRGGTKRLIIKVYGDAVNVSAKVWVSCNCEYFKYTCEVANTVHGSSSVIHSNGGMPNSTNPTLTPHLCKHLVRCLLNVKNFKGKIEISKAMVEIESWLADM